MLRTFKIDSDKKKEIEECCRFARYKIEKLGKKEYLIHFYDDIKENKIILEIALHQRKGDKLREEFAKKEIKE